MDEYQDGWTFEQFIAWIVDKHRRMAERERAARDAPTPDAETGADGPSETDDGASSE